MTRFMLLPAVIFVVAGSALAQDDTAKDLKRMQGGWAATLVEVNGQPPPDKEKQLQIKVLIKGDRYATYIQDKKVTEGSFKLDAAKKPRTIDAVASDGPNKGMNQAGIYQFEGDDLLVNFADPGGARPTEFKTKEGQVLIRYKRVKDGK